MPDALNCTVSADYPPRAPGPRPTPPADLEAQARANVLAAVANLHRMEAQARAVVERERRAYRDAERTAHAVVDRERAAVRSHVPATTAARPVLRAPRL